MMYFNVRNIVSVYIVFGITIDNSTCLDMLVESRDLTLGLDLRVILVWAQRDDEFFFSTSYG